MRGTIPNDITQSVMNQKNGGGPRPASVLIARSRRSVRRRRILARFDDLQWLLDHLHTRPARAARTGRRRAFVRQRHFHTMARLHQHQPRIGWQIEGYRRQIGNNPCRGNMRGRPRFGTRLRTRGDCRGDRMSFGRWRAGGGVTGAATACGTGATSGSGADRCGGRGSLSNCGIGAWTSGASRVSSCAIGSAEAS